MIDKLRVSISRRIVLLETLNNYVNTFVDTTSFFSMTLTPDMLLYLDAVEEDLCFGWIARVKKKISETELAQRLSPRSKKSSWTELNKERVRCLEKLGLMRDEGRMVLPDMDHNSFRIDGVIEQRLKEEDATLF